MTKRNKSNNLGITLIALVVTIIVLMILAGVAVAALMGDNGLIKRAGEAKESQRGATVQDEVTLAIAENEMIDQLNSVKGTKENKKTKRDVVEGLEGKGYLSEYERKLLLGEIEEEEERDTITIGSVVIDFSQLGRASGIGTYSEEVKSALIEGKYVSYKNKPYVVLYNNEDGIEIIAMETFGRDCKIR